MTTLPNLIVTKNIDVLGLGSSLSEYKNTENTTIGVNDIYGKHKVDIVVCIDPPHRFEPDRKAIIQSGKQSAFYTQHFGWDKLVKNYVPITLAKGLGLYMGLDSPDVCKSNNSAYVACIMAYKLGAKCISMYGVDIIGHHQLGLPRNIETAVSHFKELKEALLKRKVVLRIGTEKSPLFELI